MTRTTARGPVAPGTNNEKEAAEANTADEAIALLAANTDIDVCLLDLSLRGDSSLAPLQRIKEATPAVAVVSASRSPP